MAYAFGIDLGTTYSCISYVDKAGKAEVLKNSEGDSITPSVVMVESKNNIVVGIEAKNSIETDADKTIAFIKRKIGEENSKVELNGETYDATEISSMILKKLVNDANSSLIQNGVIQEGEEIKDVVITCPAYFGANKREATKSAGKLAGLNVLDIINEPTAAAISYGVSGKEKDETVLVYDLGGGTFDITVMNINANNVTVLCSDGDDTLGGKDWDEALLNYVCKRYSDDKGSDLSDDADEYARLILETEKWKRSLTAKEKTNISASGEDGKLREELTREKYEELTSDLLARTKNLLDDVLRVSESKGYPLSKIDKVLLVGGSTRMPQVSAMIEKDYNIKPVLADPDEAVAKGAAIYASNRKAYSDFVINEAVKQGKTAEEIMEENSNTGELDKKFALSAEAATLGMKCINVKNTLSRSYGIKIRCEDGVSRINNLIMINDPTPTSITNEYSTSCDNQEGVDIELYENKSTEGYIEIGERKPITVFNMKFQRQVPIHTGIEITISLDNSGIIHIFAVEELYGSQLTAEFKLSNQLSDEEFSNALSRMNSLTVE